MLSSMPFHPCSWLSRAAWSTNCSWWSVSSVPSRSGFSNTVTSDSRSGVECYAQLNTNTFIRHHLAIDAADLEVLAVVPVEAEPIAAAYPCIDTGALGARLYPRGSKPSHYFFRVRPRRVDFFRWRVETTFEGEAWPGREAGAGGNVWFGSHVSSSTKAARRSRFSDQKC